MAVETTRTDAMVETFTLCFGLLFVIATRRYADRTTFQFAQTITHLRFRHPIEQAIIFISLVYDHALSVESLNGF